MLSKKPNFYKSTLIIVLLLLFTSCSFINVDNVKVASTINGFELILVNKDNYLPRNSLKDREYVELWNGQKVDSAMYPDLQAMFDDLRADGLDPIVTWGFRSKETQEDLFNSNVEELMNDNMSYDDAYAQTARSIAIPGTSEHELGLAVDIKNQDNYNDALYSWLENNSYKYGFILRYPYNKTEITGIVFEPWHFRFVGHEHAKKIHEQGLTLEEYVNQLN